MSQRGWWSITGVSLATEWWQDQSERSGWVVDKGPEWQTCERKHMSKKHLATISVYIQRWHHQQVLPTVQCVGGGQTHSNRPHREYGPQLVPNLMRWPVLQVLKSHLPPTYYFFQLKTPPNRHRVACHVSCVTCHISHIPLFSSSTFPDLVGGGSVINRATASSFDVCIYF